METISFKHPTAEETVVAGFLDEDTALKLRDKVRPEDFEAELYRMIVEACNRLLRSPEPYDLRNIADYTRRVMKESDKKTSLPPGFLEALTEKDIRRAEAYCLTVKRQSQYRKAHKFSLWVQDTLIGCPDPDELHGEMMAQVHSIQGHSEAVERWTDGDTTVGEYSRILRSRKAAHEAGEVNHFPWPWQSWESRVAHLRPGDVGNIIAPTKTGKSVGLECLAEWWAQIGYQVVLVHCENSKDDTLDRRMARWSGVSIERLNSGSLTSRDLQLISTAEQNIAPWSQNLHYLNGAGLNMDEICAELEIRAADGKCQIVVLDYFNKVQHSRGTMSAFRGAKHHMEAYNAEVLKSTAVNNAFPVMTATQVIKTGLKSHGATEGSDIRGSGEILEKFQLNLTFNREKLKEERTDPQGRIIAAKGQKDVLLTVAVDSQNRGAEGEWKMIFDGPRFNIKDLPR